MQPIPPNLPPPQNPQTPKPPHPPPPPPSQTPGSQEYQVALLGKMRCLASLAEWQKLSALCRIEWRRSEPHLRKEMALLAAHAVGGGGAAVVFDLAALRFLTLHRFADIPPPSCLTKM
jgi:hypothetical protein